MPDHFDADTSLLNVAGGRPLPEDPPGFGAFAPPRRAARGREKDALFLCLGLRSRATIAPERRTELLDLAAATFFGSTGSITAALRQALAAVNQNLLDANVNTGAPVQGGLICAALRGEDFYAVQCGAGMVVAAHQAGLERFPNLPSRPLGLSNTLDAHYFHTAVREGEYFALTSSAPAGWSDAALSGLGGLATLSHVAERLKETSGGDFTAMVGRFEPGGTTMALRRAPLPSLTSLIRPVLGCAPSVAASPPTALPTPTSADAPASPPAPQLAAQPEARPAPIVESPAAMPRPEPRPPEPAAGTDWQSLIHRAERLGSAEPPPHIPVIEEIPPSRAAPDDEEARGATALIEQLKRALRSFARALGITLTEATRGLRKLLARMLPEGVLQREGLFAVPESVMLGMVIVIPLIVVGIAALVFFQSGRARLFEDIKLQAQTEVVRARIELLKSPPDPLAARPHWEEALKWLAQAEQLRPTDLEVITLQQEAQGKLDELDWVTRLDYRPLVVGGLGRAVKVEQIVLAGPDVYALDGERSRVLRLVPTPTGYNVDPEFECASGVVGQFTIGDLVDLSLIPGPNVMGSEAVVALDVTGGLLYCAPGVSPLATYLPAPDTGWIRPGALEVYADRLYVFDPGGNEVWQFQASGGAFTQSPTHYFTGASYDLQDVVDFSIAGGDLFLLRRDGRVTNCTRLVTGEAATCTESVQFTDQRPGRAIGDRLTDVAAPTRLVYDPPPEPSLYLLDENTGGLYQLSLKLLFVRQFRARLPFADPITAVVIDSAKRFFVAAGDNVYIAARP